MSLFYSSYSPTTLELENPRVLQILEAGERLFSTTGYPYSTMENIAAEAELSKATLYRYFKSKKEVLLGFLQWKLLTHLQEKDPLPSHCSVKEALLFQATRIVEWFGSAESRSLSRILIGMGLVHSELATLAYYQLAPLNRHFGLSRIFLRGIQEGILDIQDLRLAEKQFVLLCRSPSWFRSVFLSEEQDKEQIQRITQNVVYIFLSRYAATQSEPFA
jgi:AcrR family transcriptional regulator